MNNAARFSIFFINFGYVAQETFATFDEALAHTRKCGFQAQIHDGVAKELVATWCPMAGTKRYGDVA